MKFYDKIYVRKYQPESVSRIQNSISGNTFYDQHLELDPYRDPLLENSHNPDNKLKKLLRQRFKVNETQVPFQNSKSVKKDDRDGIITKKADLDQVMRASLQTEKGKEKLDLSHNPLVVKQVLNFKYPSKRAAPQSPKNPSVTSSRFEKRSKSELNTY